MSQAQTVPPFVNKTMKFVLSSPLHRMVSKSVLLITFNGCKSGNSYTTPVSYSQSGDQVTIFTYATWWKNLCNGTTVNLRLRGRDFRGLAETVTEDKQTIASGLAVHLREVPRDARWYGVTFDDHGNPKKEEIEKAV